MADLRQHLAALGYPEADLTDLRSLAIRAANAGFRTISINPRSLEMPSPPIVVEQELSLGFERLRTAVEMGDDLTPFQSKRRLNADFHDHLLTDWGIHHFHLGAVDDAHDSRFVARTGPVLYAFLTANRFLALCIDKHGTWADPQLLQVLHSQWPEVIAFCQVAEKVLNPLSRESEIRAFRQAGINAFVQLADGTVYRSLNEGGRVIDGTPLRVVMSANHLVATVRQIQKHINEMLPRAHVVVAEKRGVDPSLLRFEVVIEREGVERPAGWWLDEVTTGYPFFLQEAPG